MSLAFKITSDDEVWDWHPEAGVLARSSPHTLCIAFTLRARSRFGFDGMTYRADDTGASAQLFRIDPRDAHTMRVHVLLPDDPPSAQVHAFRLDSVSAMFKALPGLRRELPDVTLHGQAEVMAVNLTLPAAAVALR